MKRSFGFQNLVNPKASDGKESFDLGRVCFPSYIFFESFVIEKMLKARVFLVLRRAKVYHRSTFKI